MKEIFKPKEKYGGDEVFGSIWDWGDTSHYHKIQNKSKQSLLVDEVNYKSSCKRGIVEKL